MTRIDGRRGLAVRWGDEMTQTKVHSTVTPVSHYILRATAETVRWGYFSRSLQPVLSVQSGDFVTIETLRSTPMTIMHV